MVKFLLYRPIALTMSYIAVLMLGVVAMLNLPVSLIPEMDIPVITVQVNAENLSARELESTAIKPLRNSLMQIAHLVDIQSNTRDGLGVIQLQMEYGTDIDYAFIDVNEKIDQAMNDFPREIDHPKALKASASDVPVFYLNLALKNTGTPFKTTSEFYPVPQRFVELSGFADNVIKKRLEQQASVAMVDMSGLVTQELLIIPNLNKLNALGITLTQFEEQIKSMELELSNLTVKNAQYQYNIRFANSLQNKTDIENIHLKIDDHLLQLKDVAEVMAHPESMNGMVTSREQNIVTLAIIKQSDAKMEDLKEGLHELVNHFEQDYPDILFSINRDQTALLDYSISNVEQSLFWGAFFAFIVMFFFLKDLKSPLLIGITIPTSLVVSLLFFNLAGLSINIISLSGLVLGIGMMIDNSIIVIDNITQHYERSKDLVSACINGTNEVIRPMLSSVLTTCAVFIPLIFISGIAGAMFYEQALSVTIGLFVSLIVSITLLPVYFKLFYERKSKKDNLLTAISKITLFNYADVYEKGLRFTLRNQLVVWVLFLSMLGLSVLLFVTVKKENLPEIAQTETILKIDWNEPVHIEENKKRIYTILSQVQQLYIDEVSQIGTQQFLLNSEAAASASESQVYIKANNTEDLARLTSDLTQSINQNYPDATFEFLASENIFTLIFSGDSYPLTAKLRPVDITPNTNENLQALLLKLHPVIKENYVQSTAWQEYVQINVDPLKLMLYDISLQTLYTKLKSAFGEHEIITINEGQHFIPVVFGGRPKSYKEVIASLEITNEDNKVIPVSSLLRESRSLDLKDVSAGKEGEYFPLNLQLPVEAGELMMDEIRKVVSHDKNFEVSFEGEIFSNQELVKEFATIMLISVLLLYFILASQFESLTLPFIVLLEIPIDIFGVLLVLSVFGESLNLMSLIGIIVMSGIIINDSILKIDTINQLRKEGYPLMKALVVAGQRRLKPILMTSLTTVLALVPFLFTSGLGADLQRPMAIAIIGGMTIGTIVSLYFIPLFYFYLNRKGTNSNAAV
ncbi:efflux RND transporter permease subunit [Chondrinema litorale]|uniref:efflux RND transporter permease subunit n=1 Tax=Chondrinema litorale TaxID=2994555 RepID=UPI00254292CA|nr:efflux RND transporter permease subunit [Chondrinema litorale]UZR97351.1 efflux RND transporter permease subunit [Chondrinema litorale]